MPDNDLSFRIRALNAARAGFRSVLRGLRGFSSAARSIVRGISGVFRSMQRAFVVATTAIVGGVVVSIRAFIKQENASRKLEAVLKATSGAVGLTAKELEKEAAALQKVTKFGDEVIINTQAILATFKQIKGDIFKEATEAILDMATVLDQDAAQGAIQFGKALNDPAKGVAALTRVGVTFTKEQIKQIKALQKSGDTMGAQRIILRELQSEFGGAARAARNTFGGALNSLKNSFGDLLEQIGETIVKTFGLQEKIESFRKRVEDFAASSTIQTWARNTKFALEDVVTVLKAIFEGEERREIVLAGFAEVGTTIANNVAAFLVEKAPLIGDAIGTAARKALLAPITGAGRRAGRVAAATGELAQRGELGVDVGAQRRRERRQQIATAAFTPLLLPTLLAAQRAARPQARAGIAGFFGQGPVAERAGELRRLNLQAQGQSLRAGFAGERVPVILNDMLFELQENTKAVNDLKAVN